MSRPSHVALIGTCPRCGEAVEMVISKAEAKIIFKAFKRSITQAQLYSERQVEIRRRRRT